jgi:hypothetical protein
MMNAKPKSGGDRKGKKAKETKEHLMNRTNF